MPGELHTHPTAAELVDAVREFLEGTVLPEAGAGHRFHLRVAINALGMVGRELRQPPQAEADHAARLAELGAGGDAELAALIRAGAIPAGRLAQVRESVLADVEARLRVSNPTFTGNYPA